MIEYDKANVTSSYPSLTPYEVATILDKAYLALIARKLTGNNIRRAGFEYDTKAVEDLRPLIVTNELIPNNEAVYADNEYTFSLPTINGQQLLYYLEGQVKYKPIQKAADEKMHINEVVSLINHRLAQRFRGTSTNIPWISNPVSFVENDNIHVLIDSYKHNSIERFSATYIKKPIMFTATMFNDTPFELSDTMAEELISLAVTFALENVESTRLQSKTSTLQFES